MCQIAQILNDIFLKRLILDLDGHRVHPNPSKFLKDKKWLKSHFLSFRNLDQLMNGSMPPGVEKTEIGVLLSNFFDKNVIWDTHILKESFSVRNTLAIKSKLREFYTFSLHTFLHIKLLPHLCVNNKIWKL